ncbi:hypothetical protein [Lysobacter solisilvae (ex Woo and Kim 2020)]|uniref:Uncharacterized protein n=1 Tax=Agrilutibacter terrestris TaxID=2865112 RepID=A0A7H0FY70_9GAMM|nr:hypothetical protein [Lysobacter terrestris]QNP40986.1 hypothetical protein H8B22_01700 [Lysobacter terrestris]
MTTRPDHHEPLDADERDLAARLGRAGPIEGPSPALDARILAAAHAAAATHKPGRHGRMAWLGLPPAMITGVGVAAAAVLALGLVWQLRPQYGRTVTHAEGDAGEEVIIFAEPASAPRAQRANPPALPDAASADAPSRQARAEAADRVDAARAMAERAASERAAAEQAASQRAASTAATAAQRQAQAAKAAMQAAAAPLEAPREADAPASDAAANTGFAPEPSAATPASARKSHATYTTAARATAERYERAPTMASAPPPPPAPAAVAATAEAESATLDRIEVTGSRIRADTDWSQVPIRDDAKLAAAEWLERIRARRDGDDIDNARASLRLFRREHPRVRIPDDLQALLAAEAAR